MAYKSQGTTMFNSVAKCSAQDAAQRRPPNRSKLDGERRRTIGKHLLLENSEKFEVEESYVRVWRELELDLVRLAVYCSRYVMVF